MSEGMVPAKVQRFTVKQQWAIAASVAFAAIAAMIVLAFTIDPGKPVDPSAEASCRHFRHVTADVSAGILTNTELRVKLQEVHRSAMASDVPGLRYAATDMLAATTNGTLTAGIVEQFGDVCRELGE